MRRWLECCVLVSEAILSDRGLGHCVRVTDLDDAVMEPVCRELRRIWPDGTYLYSAVMTRRHAFRVTSACW